MARSWRAAFTLIELLMVVLVVGILASVAIPTYGGQKRSAQDADAFQRLEIALRHGAGQFTLHERFPAQADLVAGLAASEPHLAAQEGSGWPVGGVAVEASDLRAEYQAASRSGGRVAIRDERDPLDGGPRTIRWRATPEDVAGGPVINEVANPSFEAGVTSPWNLACGSESTCGASTIVNAPDGHGRWAANRRVRGGPTPSQSYGVWKNGVYANGTVVSVSIGDTLFMRARMRLTEGACRLQYTLTRWNAAGTELPVAAPGGGLLVTDPPLGEWVTLSGSYTVPSGVAAVTPRIGCHAVPDGVLAEVQLDRAMLVVNPPAANPNPSYVDGDSPGGAWLAGGKASGRSQGVPVEPLPPA